MTQDEPRNVFMSPELEARDALWVAIEDVDNCWTDEGDHIEWDENELPDRLIELRRAYAAFSAEPAPGPTDER